MPPIFPHLLLENTVWFALFVALCVGVSRKLIWITSRTHVPSLVQPTNFESSGHGIHSVETVIFVYCYD